MKKGWLFIFSALLACARPAFAQTGPPPIVTVLQPKSLPEAPPSVPDPSSTPLPGIPEWSSPCEGFFVRTDPGPNTWASGEALFWWVRSAPLLPTLTTFAPGSPSAANGVGGALGLPGTIVLSPDRLGYNMFGGGRFIFGGWLDAEQSIGLEASGFFLGSQNASFAAASGGTPPLRVPFTNASPPGLFPPGQSSFILADPGLATGGQVVRSSLRLGGAEGNALFRAVRDDALNVSFLIGFRYLDLQENLSIGSNENQLPPLPASAFALDSFATRNQFYGGQLGVKAQTQIGPFDGLLVFKLGLGDNHQTVTANGATAIVGNGFITAPGIYPGGIYTQTTNIGQRSRNEFCVVPELQLQVGYNLSSRVRAFAGYNFLALSDAVRPSDQIDRTLNFSSSAPVSGAVPPVLIGAPRPEPLFNGSNFWAQGVNLGIELKF